MRDWEVVDGTLLTVVGKGMAPLPTSLILPKEKRGAVFLLWYKELDLFLDDSKIL